MTARTPRTVALLALWAAGLPAQVPGAEPVAPAARRVRVVVGGPSDLRARLLDLARLELDPSVKVVPGDAGDVAAAPDGPTVLFAADELELRRLAAEGRLDVLQAGGDLAPGFRDPEGRFALTLLSPITLAFDTRVWSVETAPRTWEDLPFATAGEDSVGAIDPALDPVPMAGWITLQAQQGFGEDRAFGWLAALDARIRGYSASHRELLEGLHSGRASLAPLPLHLVRRAAAQGLAVGHRLPREGLPARALGVALRIGSAGSEPARAASARLLGAAFSRRCAADLGLIAALRADEGTERPAAERELMARLVRPPGPGTVDRWLRRFDAEVRGRGAELERVDTVLEIVFGALFAGFLFFVWLRVRRSDARDAAP